MADGTTDFEAITIGEHLDPRLGQYGASPGEEQLYHLPARGGELVRITGREGKVQAAPSPDGSRLALRFESPELLPDLSTCTEIPATMKKLMDAGDNGISTGKGFYEYSEKQAKQWEELFTEFNYEIRRLLAKYPSDCGNREKTKTDLE